MFNFPRFSFRTVMFITGFAVLLAGFLGISLQNRSVQTAQADLETVALVRPGADVVEYSLDPTDTTTSGPQVLDPVPAIIFDIDVRTLPQDGPPEKGLNVEFEPEGAEGFDPNFDDPVAQTFAGPLAMPAPIQNFAGLDLQNWGAGWPPDTNGDVGPNHYIQTVNTSIGIYSKTGTQLAAFTFDNFFGGTGTPCDASNNGDPIVLYDALSDRWIITDFAWTNIDNGPYYECIAVSQTGDPVAGGWYFYGLVAHNSLLNDYPKLGVWEDGIYMTSNMFDCILSCGFATFQGVRIWALDRTSMINGQPLTGVVFDLGSAYASLLPANFRGASPPAGSPNYLGAISGSNTFRTWKLDFDEGNPGNSTLSGPLNTTVASFSNPSSIPQGGSSTSLDSLAGRLMMQLQYRNIGGTESLWVTHTVSNGGVASLRWYELRNLSGTPTVHQQGTYQPDSNHRWMGSVAVDGQGNMAIGYSVSSSSIHPQIRYAGRLVSDPLNTLGQGEVALIAGTGSQTNFSRWGDYSAMTIDPVDDCTFWYTTEYYVSTGTNWQTRIGSFKFPSCDGGPTPTPTITPTPTMTPTPTNTPPPGSFEMHVANIDMSVEVSSNRFFGRAVVTIVDTNNQPLSGASVFGTFSGDSSGPASGVTNANGEVTLDSPLTRNGSNWTFCVENVTLSGWTYNSAANVETCDSTGGGPTETPTPTATPPPGGTMHIGDLDDASTPNGNRWDAIVVVTVHDENENPLAGVTVSGTWSNGANGNGSCVTDASGQCSIARNNIRSTIGSADFTVTNASGSFSYQPNSNHDPDGDSNGTTITVVQP